MKKNRLGVVVALVLFTAASAQAQVWTGATNNLWTNPSNWVGGVAPVSGPTTTVDFGPGPTTISFTPSVDVPQTINVMNLTGAGFTFSNQPLSFDGANAALNVTQPGSTMGVGVNFSTTVTLDNSHPFTLGAGMSGPGTLVKTGAGTLIVSGSSWHNGATTVAAGTLQVGDGTNGPLNITAPIAVAGSLVFNLPPFTISLSQGITGAGSLVVEANTGVSNNGPFAFSHQGSTTLHGNLNATSGAIDSNGPVLISSTGSLSVSTNSTVGSIAGTGNLAVFSNTLSTGSDDSSTTFSGFMSGNGRLRKTGAGTFTIASNQMVDGLVTVEAPGTLRIGDGTTGPSNGNGGFVANGALVLDRNAGFSLQGSITGTGTVRIEGGTSVSHSSGGPWSHQGSTTVIGSLTSAVIPSIDNNAPLLIGPLGFLSIRTSTVGSLSGSGTLSLFNGILSAGGDDSSTTYSGQIAGGLDDFRKVGAGTLTLATTSWFQGDVTVEAPGTLRIGNGSLGPGSVNNLFVNGAIVFDAPNVNLNGTLTGTGTVRVEAGKSVFNSLGQPLSHQGSTTVNGVLEASSPMTSISNNSLLLIGPSGTFGTRTGQVGSLSGSGQLTIHSGIFTVGGDNTSTTYSGLINGTGDFRKVGSGTLTLAGTSFFGGSVSIEAPGALRLGNGSTGPGNVTSMLVDGTLFFNTPNVNATGTITGAGSITVQTGSTVNLNLVAPMTHAGTTTISGQLNSPALAAIDNNAPLLLSGGLVTRGGNVGSVSGSGTLQLTGNTFTTGGNNAATAYAGVLSGSGTLAKVGNGTFTLSGASPTYTGAVQVSTGTLHVSGTLASSGVVVVTGGNLTGTGSIVAPINVEIGANLSPGPTVASLNTGSLSLAGNVNIEIQGTAPGTQHDRLNVTGTVAINGATLALSGGYVPVTGNTFTIIQNDGADPVVGTFAGLPEGATLTLNGTSLRITYAGGTGNDVVLALASYTVTPSAGPNGSISPSSPQGVAPGGTVTFTVSPGVGYAASVGGTCGGNLSGTTYTTNPINSDCTVVASFSLTTFTVTPSAGPNGSIAPSTPQPVAPGGTLAFTVTPNTGYTTAVGGTCGGNLVGNTYTTNPVNANCTVLASFSLNTYTVTPSAGPNGTITPSTPQTVAHGAVISFAVTPDPTFQASVGGTCGGTLSGNTYTSNPITASCTVNVTFELVNPHRLLNISTRMQVLTGDNVLIGGFVIGGSANKTVAIVAAGPSLASFGIANPLSNPTLTLVRSSDQVVIGTNNDWQTASTASQLQAAGLAPSDPLESAILVNLAPGAYTAIVQGVGNATGVGMVAVYEVDAATVPITNLSTRGRVLTGNDVMIGGFIIGGSGSQTVAIVATGPSLAAHGIANPLANPTLTLVRSSDQAVIATNDDWATDTNAAQLTAAGLAPPDALEAALYITLPPGAYTAILSGVGGGTGVGVIGVYKVN